MHICVSDLKIKSALSVSSFPAGGSVPHFPAGKKMNRARFKWIIVVNQSNVSIILNTKCITMTFSYDYDYIMLLCECKHNDR